MERSEEDIFTKCAKWGALGTGVSLENCGSLGARYVWAGGGRNLTEELGDDH